MALRRPLVLLDGKPAEIPVGDTVAASVAPGSGGSPVFSTVEKNLGKGQVSGSFSITGLAGLTIGKQVMLFQAPGPYTGKGTRADEAEMDQVNATGVVVSATQIDVYWHSNSRMVGNVKFNYLIGG